MDGDKLKAEIHLDINSLANVSQNALNHITEKLPLDVSIGVLAHSEKTEGTFNNENYVGIVQSHEPDHLALLPDEVGACSWDDGCGIRNSKNNKLLTINKMKDGKKVKIEEAGVLLTLNNTTVELFGNSELANNELGYREIGRNIQRQLDAMDTATTYNYLVEVYEDHFIYSVGNSQTNSEDYYKRPYQVNSADELELEGDPVKVQRKVTFEVMSSQEKSTKIKMQRTINVNKNKVNTMAETKGSPCKVDAVIANTANQFAEGDREFLSGLEDLQLDKFIQEKKDPIINKDNKDKVTEEQILKVISNAAKTPEEFINKFMPESMRESVTAGIQLNQEKRDSLIKGIVANSSFTEENLKSWGIPDLQKMHDSVVEPEPSNYSGLGAGASGTSKKLTKGAKMMLNFDKEEK